jgi:hypothetical protein
VFVGGELSMFEELQNFPTIHFIVEIRELCAWTQLTTTSPHCISQIIFTNCISWAPSLSFYSVLHPQPESSLKMPALQATVKSVLSGDTVTLVNAKGAERSLSLAYVSAPRLKRDGDEVNCSSA